MSSNDGIKFELERKQSTLLFDTRSLRDKLRSNLSGEAPVVVLAAMAGVLFLVPASIEVVVFIGLVFYFYVRSIQKSAGLVLRMPKSSNEIDPKELSLKTQKPVKSEGIIYMGNDMDTGEEVWLTDVQARTHMLFMGTTGSGKTEALISLVYNSLVHGSGLIYVDGKADISLYGKLYSMARAMGRDDDVLVINFQTGAKDIYGAQPTKLSNTLNPFANGSSGMLSELVKGLMATGEKSTWTQQAESFVEALMKPLVYLRDHHGLNLDVNVIREYFELNKLEDLAWRDGDLYPGLVESGVLDGLHNYLLTKPAYKKEKYHDQSETTNEQHGYISMQLIRTFNSLADTYGYIMKTPLAEIDFVDVFLNRRILIVLLPALEKSETELTNLGRIVVASIKSTMAKGLGSGLEGTWKKVIESKPTTAPSPFLAVLDEYGYYAVTGFSVVPAQARSIGFSAIFAGQDLPAFEKASKEEAKSTLANTNTRLCGKLECTQTYQYFKDIAGAGMFTKIQRYEREDESLTGSQFKTDNGISIDRVDRVSFDALRGQVSGQWHLFFANTIIRLKSFFANPKPVKNIRVNHFIKVARPDAAEIAAFHKTYEVFTRAVSSDGGLMSYMDRVSSPPDITDIHEGFDLFKADAPLQTASKVLAYCALIEERRSNSFISIGQTAPVPAVISRSENLDIPFDFSAHMGETMRQSNQDTNTEEAAPDDDSFIDSSQRVENKLFGNQPQIRETSATQNRHSTDEPSTDIGGLFLNEYAPESTSQDETGEQVDDGLFETNLDEDFEVDASSDWPNVSNPTFDSAKEVTATKAQLIPVAVADGAQFFEQTSVFGANNYALPSDIIDVADDVAIDAIDRPNEIDQVGDGEFVQFDESEFEAPLAEDGLLSREATLSGVAAIERMSGADQLDSERIAAAVVESVSRSTTYPMTQPKGDTSMAAFEGVARKLSQLVSVSADEEA